MLYSGDTATTREKDVGQCLTDTANNYKGVGPHLSLRTRSDDFNLRDTFAIKGGECSCAWGSLDKI